MESKRGIFLKILGFVILLIIFFFSGIVIAVVVSYFLFTVNSPNPFKTEKEFYQLQVVRTGSNKDPSLGIAELAHQISNDQYVTYRNKDSQVYISKFGGSKYKCYGSCTCNSESRRVAGAHVLSKGLFVLLSAITTTMAVNMAKDAFEEDCVDKFEGVCMKAEIDADVRDCTPVDDGKAEENENVKKYMCSGICAKNPSLSEVPEIWKETKESWGINKKCEDLKYQQDVKIECFKGEDCTVRAKDFFLRLYMKKFCEEGSKFEAKTSFYENNACSGSVDKIECVEVESEFDCRIDTK